MIICSPLGTRIMGLGLGLVAPVVSGNSVWDLIPSGEAAL